MEGKIVEVIKMGETTMVFHDDFCRDKTQEEIQAILDRIAAIALPGLRAAYYRKMKEAQESCAGGQ